MQLGNAAFELAEQRAEQERDAGVARAQAAVAARPVLRMVCDCGEQISEARRRAAPFTDKCIDCAARAEKRRRA